MILRCRTWGDVKPSRGTALSVGHPLAQGLLCLWSLHPAGVSATESLACVGLRSPTRLAYAGGTLAWNPIGAYLAGGATDYFGNTSPGFGVTAFTAEAWWDGPSGQPFNYVGWMQHRVASLPGFQVTTDFADSGTYLSHLVIWDGTSETAQYKSSVALTHPFGRQTHLVWTWDGTAAAFYIDGRSVGAVTSAVTGYSSSAGFALGHGYAAIAGTIMKASLYDRALSATEVRWLSRDPWAMFAPPAPRLRYAVAPAAVGTVPILGGARGAILGGRIVA